MLFNLIGINFLLVENHHKDEGGTAARGETIIVGTIGSEKAQH